MNEEARERKGASLTLMVKARLEQVEEKELPEIVVYAFDRTGQFLTSASLPKGEETKVKLELPSELRGTTVRVLFGPPLVREREEIPLWMGALMREGGREDEKEAPSRAALMRRGAYEKRVRLHTAREALDVAIFPSDWTKWLLCPCVVRGRLVKRLALPDGTSKELGVCSACVKIYEVDKFPRLILRLPEHDLLRLRDDLRTVLERWSPKFPPKELPPEPKPRVWPPPPPSPVTETASAVSASTSVGALQPRLRTEVSETKAETSPPTSQIRAELEPIFMASSVTQLRNALIVKADLLVQFACIWEWLHSYFHTDLIKYVCTDEQGRFETTIWYPCGGDKPDLYFEAVQCIDCVLHTIYDPGVACHTYWNYACGSEVVLEVTDPAARTCVPPDPVDPPPGVPLWVMPYAVGGIRLNRIKSSGLTDYGGIVDAPFGSPEDKRLGFRHGYSSTIPATGLYYYRWRYKKDGEPGWHDFSETVVRHYVEELPGELPTFPTFKLGPYPVNGMHLYRFRPHDPPPPSDSSGHTYWPTDSWFADIYSAFLDTYSLPGGVDASAGKYKIKLEIYDSAGNRVAPGSGTFQFIVPTGVGTDGETILTRAASPAEIQNDGFVFYLHLDNRECSAAIDAPTIGGVGADPDCGFLRYTTGDRVSISFHALHPANFATFSFWMKRAAHTVYPASGEVTAMSVAGYTGDGSGNFEDDFSTGDLLGTCNEAAFEENLRVYAKATNGWRRLWEYDDHDERAFAIAPKTE